MKMIYNGAPIKSLNVKHYEMSTQDATLKASDMQAGITAYARGQKITGTGKCFEFARYGAFETNNSTYIPTGINVIEIASTEYGIKHSIQLSVMKNIDFTVPQTVGTVVVSNTENPIVVQYNAPFLTISCDENVALEIFYGKDNYI